MRRTPVRVALAAVAVLASATITRAADKAVWHYVSLPLIEGCGIYTSVATLVDSDASVSSYAASGANLGILAAQGTLGLLSSVGSDRLREKLRPAHRVVGFAVTAAALWLAVSNSADSAPAGRQVAGYGYTAMSVVPLVMFRF